MDSLSYLKEAYHLSCLKFGEESFESVKINSNLGSLYAQLNMPEEAEKRLQQCNSALNNSFITYPKRLKIFGIVLSNLGELYRLFLKFLT